MQTSTSIYTNGQSMNVVFMPGMFNETMQLLTDAHEYFSQFGDDDQKRLDDQLRSVYSCEMSRITLRLSSIMTWIMAQRAVFAGKIESQDAAKHYGLDFQDVCLVDNRVLHGIMPAYVCFLLDRSLELYERVCRLDGQVKKPH